MQLYLIRHGIAEDIEEAASDAARALTARGRGRLERSKRGMELLGLQFDLLLTSPWTRAAESAEILAELSASAPRSTAALAAPPGEALIAELEEAEHQGLEHVALVGHEPWLSELCAWLTAGAREVAGTMRLRKGGIVHLSGDPHPGGMQIEALHRPSHLRRIGDDEANS